MGDSIRSLTVKLGYDIDTTGADIFKSRFKSLQASLKTGSQLKGFADGFNQRFNMAGEKMKSNARKVLAALAVTIAAGIAGATKVFKGFATIETARGALEFRAGDQFDETIKSIEKTREETGNLISELDALNAFNLGADIIGDFDFLAKNFGTVIKLSKVLGKDVGEVQQAFANFVATGSNLQELVKFGFFTPEQLDALKKASTDFSQQGLQTRKTLLTAKIQEGAPRLETSFQAFLGKSQASLDKLGTAAEDLTIAIGEKLSPQINKTVTDLQESISNAKTTLDEGGGLFDAWLSSFQSEAAKNVIGFLQSPLTPGGQAGGFQNTAQGYIDNSNTVINVNGAGDPEVVARKVEAKMAKKIINNSVRREVPQTLNTTIQPEQ